MSAKTKYTTTEAKAKPALHIQVGGIRIPIWKNEGGEDGKVYFKAGEPTLSYKGKDGNYRTGKSYGERELIHLIKAAALAHSEVSRRNQASAKAPTTE